jgi:hypothetical protein
MIKSGVSLSLYNNIQFLDLQVLLISFLGGILGRILQKCQEPIRQAN